LHREEKIMKRYALGFLAGLTLGVATTAVAATALGDRYLMGWAVTVRGRQICQDPFIWSATKEIECD
jgi:hypothetical protein